MEMIKIPKEKYEKMVMQIEMLKELKKFKKARNLILSLKKIVGINWLWIILLLDF